MLTIALCHHLFKIKIHLLYAYIYIYILLYTRIRDSPLEFQNNSIQGFIRCIFLYLVNCKRDLAFIHTLLIFFSILYKKQVPQKLLNNKLFLLIENNPPDDDDDEDGGDASLSEMAVGLCFFSVQQQYLVILKEERAHATHFTLLLDEDLKVLINDGHGQQDTRAGTDGAHKIGNDRQSTDAQSTESRRRRNVSVQFVNH